VRRECPALIYGKIHAWVAAVRLEPRGLPLLLGERLSDRLWGGRFDFHHSLLAGEAAEYGLSKYVVAPAHKLACDAYLAHTPFVLKSKPSIRRAGRAAVALLSLSFLLTGCASRPEVGALLANHEMNAVGKDHTILVATTRDRDPRPGTYFGGKRSESVSYATITVAVPPTHEPGKIEWPSQAPGNPATDFVVRDAAYLDSERDFVKALNAQLALRPPGRRKVFVFIHGYNTMFAEGLYRFTQIVDDADAPGFRSSSPGPRAVTSRITSTIPTAQRRHATNSSIPCVWSLQQCRGNQHSRSLYG